MRILPPGTLDAEPHSLPDLIEKFLFHCRYEKNLSLKTIKAYRTDLIQFKAFIQKNGGGIPIQAIDPDKIKPYVKHVSEHNKPKTLKRKLASLKAFFNQMEFEGTITATPFRKLRIKIKESHQLPRTIELPVIRKIFRHLYDKKEQAQDTNTLGYQSLLRDIAVLETLFSTGMRVSEVCNLKPTDVDLAAKTLLVNGKGDRERLIPICTDEAIAALKAYYMSFKKNIQEANFFFINRIQRRLSEQSVRFMIRKYVTELKIKQHITPHMFRHSVATLLLEDEVDIRYIQNLLGHQSISTTQIYAHVNQKAQRKILTKKHPRKRIL